METNTIDQIARSVIEDNYPYYNYDLLDLVPACLLKVDLLKIQEGSMLQVMKDLDGIRFLQESAWKMADKLSIEDLTSLINSPIGSLPPDQELRRRKIKFLFNVCARAIHS